ncbi:MAG: hypothetical protein NVS4B11_00890 [Ktedonobacteraceae bacterium]
MSQNALTPQAVSTSQADEHSHGGTLLGPLLCWAVVFADIGTSVYYVPGILYGNVGDLAGFFVLLTMSVFVLLTLKYAEVTHRFPQGGGVVTVAASALNKWWGALGGMFILVDYFLTASISSISGMQYLSVVLPPIGISTPLPFVGSVQLVLLLITMGVLIVLGFLNWVGISESAKISLVGAIIAFGSDVVILITVFTHLTFSQVLSLFSEVFANHTLTPVALLVGFAGSFLAFSGLESISQLSPVMKTPRKRVAGLALLLVVLTIGITSPLLTVFSTLLLPHQAADLILSNQLISLLGGHWGNVALQTEVAISASALLIFASNTAIIGAYHVFMALSRLGFFPDFVLKRNKLRDTPHYSILLATAIPIIVLILVAGNITILGDMYAFGLLGAFTLTCLGMDIIRTRDRRSAHALLLRRKQSTGSEHASEVNVLDGVSTTDQNTWDGATSAVASHGVRHTTTKRLLAFWRRLDFWLGILTTGLVVIAWSTNLVAKPLATLFGGTISIIGMTIAYFNYRHQERQGQALVHVTPLSSVELMADATLAVLLTGHEKQNTKVVQAAIQRANGHPLVFLYVGEPVDVRAPQPFEYYEPYLSDVSARKALRDAEVFIRHAKVNVMPQFLYQPVRDVSEAKESEIVTRIWQTMHPHELLIAAEDVAILHDVNPDRIRYQLTPKGRVAHFVSR